jgi:hypothetical protein
VTTSQLLPTLFGFPSFEFTWFFHCVLWNCW